MAFYATQVYAVQPWAHGTSQLHALAKCLDGIGATLLTGLLPSLRRVTLQNGELVALGAGTKPLLWTNTRYGLSQWMKPWGWGVYHWAKVACGAVAAIAPVRMGLHFSAFIDAWNNGATAVMINRVLLLPIDGLVLPLVIAWYVTLKMAASLVAYPIVQVRKAVERCDPGSSEWQTDVVAETLKLAKDVMPTLSNGWGGGAAVMCILCWVTALAQVCYAIDTEDSLDPVLRLLMASMMGCLPLAAMYDLAACVKSFFKFWSSIHLP
eukprot:SAG11_NODE_629_length_8073_cov_6.782042_6_plen_266_part_00